jgi:hypothetical protein
MRFSLFDLNKLVRPKILSHPFLYDNTEPQNFDRWWKEIRIKGKAKNCTGLRSALKDTYQRELPVLFEGLLLGDLADEEKWSISYAGKITGFVILYRGIYHLANTSEKIKQFIKCGKQAKIKGFSIKFFSGIEKDQENGEIIPVGPWKFTDEKYKGKEFIWFYDKSQVIALEHLVSFEGITPGNLLTFKRSKSLAISNELMNRPKFYKIGSWTSHIVKFYNSKTRSLDRLIPNKSFIEAKVAAQVPL